MSRIDIALWITVLCLIACLPLVWDFGWQLTASHLLVEGF